MRRLKFPMEGGLESVRNGGSFDRFAKSTRSDWKRIAGYLWRRWSLPDGVEVEDVEQELLLHAWQAIRRWEDGRGPTLRSFVVWSSITGTKKWMHAQRSALRRDDRAPSRFPVSMSRLGLDLVECRASVEPNQEAFVMLRERLNEEAVVA